MNIQSTVTSWGVVILIGGGSYWYYSRQRRQRRGDHRRNNVAELDGGSRRQQTESKSKRDRDRASTMGEVNGADTYPPRNLSIENGGHASRPRPKPAKTNAARTSTQSSSATKTSNVEAVRNEPRGPGQPDADGDISTAEFARRMTSAQAGAKLQAPEKTKQGSRTIKQSQARKKESSVTGVDVGASTASSTDTGPELDELSSANSPALGATTPSSDSTGISDMLESPTPKPQVLRLTDPEHGPRPHQPKPKAPAEQPLSKKQRQRKAKNEVRKAEAAEQEKERRKMMEQQRRTAREAEGRPARDGSGWTYGAGPAPTAWPASRKTATESAKSINGPLLDTLGDLPEDTMTRRQEVLPPEVGVAAAVKEDNGVLNGFSGVKKQQVGSSSAGFSATTWENGYPSEEEQMRLIKEQQQSEQWTTVAAKRGLKKTKAQTSDEEKAE